jgi:hypothetical protein
MTIRWVVVITCALAGLGACKKKDAAKQEAAKTDGDEPAGGVAANDLWGDAASGGGNKLAAATGDEFAKLDGGKVAQLAAKVDVATLEKPVSSKVELMSLSTAGLGAELTGFKVVYNPGRSEGHEEYRKIFQQNHVFEQAAEGLNKTIRLPTKIDINTLSCNTINAFYDPNGKRIIVCYELLDYFLNMFKPVAKNDSELGNAVLGATMFGFFHEVGHGLIHQLDLPAVGREEDSVDQLATLTLIAAGDEGVAMALSGAHWFQLQSKGEHTTPFWDEHAFDGQRFYNILCLIYGSNPGKYAGFVSSGNLPSDRAQRCPDEYQKIHKAWEKLLQPHLTNGAASNIDYKPNIPVAEAPKTTTDDPWGNTEPSAVPSAPAPPEEPRAPAAPAAPASEHVITCEQVAMKAITLIAEEAEARARKMSPAEVEELKAKLEAELPAAMETILSECAKRNWPDSSRQCVIDATSLKQASACQ